MPAIPSDVNIKARWIAPMTSACELLEAHTLVIRDGRILDVLPHEEAAERYAPCVELDRPAHLAMPGLVNARTRIAPLAGDSSEEAFWADGALLSIANMLKAGVYLLLRNRLLPREVAAMAVAQGVRAVIGLPVAEHSSAWAQSPGECLTRALKLHDEYRGHPSISTRFAPLARTCSAMRRFCASEYWPPNSTRGFFSRCTSRSMRWRLRCACAASARSGAIKIWDFWAPPRPSRT